jgi:hypothetical protein
VETLGSMKREFFIRSDAVFWGALWAAGLFQIGTSGDFHSDNVTGVTDQNLVNPLRYGRSQTQM